MGRVAAAHTRTVPFDGRELDLAEVAEMVRREEVALALFPGRGKPIEQRAGLAWGPSVTLRTTVA